MHFKWLLFLLRRTQVLIEFGIRAVYNSGRLKEDITLVHCSWLAARILSLPRAHLHALKYALDFYG